MAAFYFRFVDGFVASSFQPHSGPEAGGTVVTVTGLFSSPSCYCMFGNTPPSPCLSVSDTEATCITSAHAPKIVLLRVSPDKTFYTNVGTFRFLAAASLARVSPSAGTCDGRCLTPQPFTLHPKPSTLKPTPYTLHPKPYTLNPRP